MCWPKIRTVSSHNDYVLYTTDLISLYEWIDLQFANKFLHLAADSIVRDCLKGKGVQLVKKKKTIYPEWNTSFDFHLYEGRVIHMEIVQRPDRKVAECSILAQSLADLAKDGEATNIWVITRLSSTFTVNTVSRNIFFFSAAFYFRRRMTNFSVLFAATQLVVCIAKSLRAI